MNKINRFWTVFISILIGVPLFWNYNGARAIATERSNNISDTCNQALSPNSSAKNRTNKAMILGDADSVAESQSISDITQASFWWAAEQFDPFNGKLVQNWLTSPQKREINLVVNWQLWTLLDYFGRYRFVNQFGTVARKYGYSLNVFNQKAQCLASYKYNSFAVPPKWELNLGKFGRDSLPIEPQKISDQ
ncbi:MAG: hypothetical protein AAGE84_05330 [Cyanobacteria bacterium P01_G01_bin.39]